MKTLFCISLLLEQSYRFTLNLLLKLMNNNEKVEQTKPLKFNRGNNQHTKKIKWKIWNVTNYDEEKNQLNH